VRKLLAPSAALLFVLALFGLSSVAGRATSAAVSDVTYIIPAGQTNNATKATLTGAGQYSYFAPTFDRAAKNHSPNRARLLGEVYLGDGGATATYTIKTLSPTPKQFSLWIYYTDDGLHPSGARAVVVSIPQLKWSIQWSNTSQDTKGWKAVKIGTITTSGNITVSFRKTTTTSAAFVMNAFALTTGAQPPAFGPASTSANVLPKKTAGKKGSATAKIVGSWHDVGVGTITVKPTVGGWTGTVTTSQPVGHCTYSTGEVVWHITQNSAGSFVGTIVGWGWTGTTCERATITKVVWSVSGNSAMITTLPGANPYNDMATRVRSS
jgi:hypothetical protein